MMPRTRQFHSRSSPWIAAAAAYSLTLFACAVSFSAPDTAELLSPWKGVQGVFPDRVETGGTVLVWGVDLAKLTIVNEAGEAVNWPRADLVDRVYDVERWAIRGFMVPEEAGTYLLSIPDSHHTRNVSVIPRQIRGPELVIPAGYHRWNAPKDLAEGTTLLAYGAVIDGQGGSLFKLAPNCRILGGTYQNFTTFVASGNGDGLVIADAHIRGGRSGAGWSHNRLTIRDSILERWFLHLDVTDGALLQRNRFIGLTKEGHAFRCVQAKHLVMIDNVFDGTDRGIVFQPQRGAVENSFFYRNTFRNIDYVHGGNEVFLVELGPHPFRWNMNFHQRVYNCGAAAVLMWGCSASDNLWYDLKSVDSGGIVLMDVADHPQGRESEQVRNLFIRSELQGGRVRFGQRARHNVVAETGVISPTATRSHSQVYRPDWYKAGVIFDASIPGNRIIRCSIYNRNGFVVGRNVVLEDISIEPNDPRRQ